MNRDNYLVIQGWMITELNLKGNDLLVYAIIYGFSQTEDQYFKEGLKYLADWCASSKQGISKNLKNLIDRNLIEKVEYTYNKIGYRCSTKLNTDVQQSLTPSCHIYMEPSNNGSDKAINKSNRLINNDNMKDKKDKSTDRAVSRGDVDMFVELYHKHCPDLPKVRAITDKRKKSIQHIVSKYGWTDVITVFNLAQASDFLKHGAEDGGWNGAGIDFILREDKFISILEGKYDNRTKRKQSADGLPVPKKVTKEELENDYIYKF